MLLCFRPYARIDASAQTAMALMYMKPAPHYSNVVWWYEASPTTPSREVQPVLSDPEIVTEGVSSSKQMPGPDAHKCSTSINPLPPSASSPSAVVAPSPASLHDIQFPLISSVRQAIDRTPAFPKGLESKDSSDPVLLNFACMPLTLLPTVSLSSAQEFLTFEVTCTGRPSLRPALSSQDSFASSHSGSSNTSATPRRSRPTLSPEALLVHAFGPSALSRFSPPIGNEGQTSQSSSSSSRDSSKSRRRKHSINTSSLPPQPPPGTFRSTPKPVKIPSNQLSLSELNPFQMHGGDSMEELRGDMSSRECERSSIREPLMSPVKWREKVEGRVQRRKLLRLRDPPGEAGKMPLDIDCRPMEGSMNLAPATEMPNTRKSKSKKRDSTSPVLSKEVAEIVKQEAERLLVEEKKGTSRPSSRQRPIMETNDLDDLIKQCDKIRLQETSD
ncbi:uncharacterized protein FOMMEDRAFT_171597 [Fomitiporia mediterranea MF3/22]|uniref:Uncharacterized protein n=1 Tax=Fomitiporia mediterranea (strain MF3/22) TaxID=694068 RepID=R7SJ79_FOMME|nr:uncharacterized protein FOMMEDRAFT_171597 [Fomitiporia mediterranea MF3/22]EJC97669.1 hypothetical protein FOMMEDRAFT_171597 [Fomitiporia mediterranea MF3/22]